MLLPLSECTRLTGISRSGLLKAINRGRVSASRDDKNGMWVIDSAELSRVYEIKSPADTAPTPDDTGSAVLAERLKATEMLLDAVKDERDYLRRRIEEDANTISRLSGMLTDARTAPDTSAHTPPPPKKTAFWVVIVLLSAVCAGLAVFALVR